VNPYIVVPGQWSDKDIETQADVLISYKMVNNGHICASPQVILTCKNWPQREQFLAAVRRQVKKCPPTRLFYPGVKKAYDEHKMALGGGDDVTVQESNLFGDDQSPLLLRTGVSADEEVKEFGTEAFSPVLIEVPLDTEATFDAYLPKAVDFAHHRCWGSLTCQIVVDDATKAINQQSLDKILDGMHFGTVGVNIPASTANGFPALCWGGFPGHTQRDVQSGIGYLGNFGCFKNLEKCVLQGRFHNLLQFSTAGSPQYKEKRQRRLSEVLVHNGYWSIFKFACAHFTGL